MLTAYLDLYFRLVMESIVQFKIQIIQNMVKIQMIQIIQNIMIIQMIQIMRIPAMLSIHTFLI